MLVTLCKSIFPRGFIKCRLRIYLRQHTAIPISKATQQPIGYAFVDFSLETEAQQAAGALPGMTTLDRHVAMQSTGQSGTVDERQPNVMNGAASAYTAKGLSSDNAHRGVDMSMVSQTPVHAAPPDRSSHESKIQRRLYVYEDDALGNRKRTHTDVIKGTRQGGEHINGSILPEWYPKAGQDPTPWVKRSKSVPMEPSLRYD